MRKVMLLGRRPDPKPTKISGYILDTFNRHCSRCSWHCRENCIRYFTCCRACPGVQRLERLFIGLRRSWFLGHPCPQHVQLSLKSNWHICLSNGIIWPVPFIFRGQFCLECDYFKLTVSYSTEIIPVWFQGQTSWQIMPDLYVGELCQENTKGFSCSLNFVCLSCLVTCSEWFSLVNCWPAGAWSGHLAFRLIYHLPHKRLRAAYIKKNTLKINLHYIM